MVEEFLKAYGRDNLDEEIAFIEFSSYLEEKGCCKDQLRFVTTKTKYEHSVENEIRIIKLRKDEKIANNRCSKQIIKPEKAYILSTSGQECIITLLFAEN